MRLVNIFKSITMFLKNHVWCLVVYFSTITLFIWGADGDLANRAGFAASIVSIVLAIVVIVFTIQESNRMQRMIERFGQKFEKGQEELKNTVSAALNLKYDGGVEFKSEITEKSTKPLPKENSRE